MDYTEGALLLAYNQALQSPDPSNQCGAVVTDGLLVCGGCNDFPDFITQQEIDANISDRDWKLKHIRHAEQSACLAWVGQAKQGDLVMYCPWAACIECAKDIHASQITRLVVHKQRMDLTPERWKKSVDDGLDYLARGGVTIEYCDTEIVVPGVLVNGEKWYG